MTVSNKNIGATIARLRIQRNLTQQQLAAILGVSHQAVSKWENGTALPDLDSLVEISHLFGMTLDQLINNEDDGAARPRIRRGVGRFSGILDDNVIDSLRSAADSAYKTACDIGKAVGDSVSDAYSSVAKACKDAAHEAKQAYDEAAKVASQQEAAEKEEAELHDEKIDEAAENVAGTMSLQALIDLAPFMSREKLTACVLEHRDEMTPELLKQFAPFISRDAMSELIDSIGQDKFTIDSLIIFAPFLNRDKLFGMVIRRVNELDIAKLSALAPFLRRGMVDALTDAVNGVQNAVTPDKLDAFTKKTVDTAKDVLGKLKDAVAKQDFGTVFPDDGTEESANAEAPAQEEVKPAEVHVSPSLKDKVAQAALDNGNWAWLRQHVSELTDSELLKNICLKAVSELEEADATDIVLNAAPYLSADAASEVMDALCDNGAWAQAIDICPFAQSECCARNIAKAAASAQTDAVKAFAAHITQQQLDDITHEAINSNNWDLINALPL